MVNIIVFLELWYNIELWIYAYNIYIYMVNDHRFKLLPPVCSIHKYGLTLPWFYCNNSLLHLMIMTVISKASGIHYLAQVHCNTHQFIKRALFKRIICANGKIDVYGFGLNTSMWHTWILSLLMRWRRKLDILKAMIIVYKSHWMTNMHHYATSLNFPS